jgi:hypothetical protein
MRCKSALLASLALLLVATPVRAAYPITGSFVTADLGNDPAVYRSMLQEMKQSGIDNIVIFLGDIEKDCTTSKYTDYSFLTMPNRAEGIVIKEALAANLKMYFGLQNGAVIPCFAPHEGTPTNPHTNMGHILAHSRDVINDFQQFLTANNIAWTDERIAGFYITQEIETYWLSNVNAITAGNKVVPSSTITVPFYTEISKLLKPYNKPILFSPWQSNRTNYSLSLEAYKNIIAKTDITIIAPQDSFGTGKTTDFNIDRDHFRALADAKAAYPEKNVTVWANIETFTHTPFAGYTPPASGRPVTIFPAPFTRIQQQIETVRPYVSKMTSWIYQYAMLSTPESQNAYQTTGWNTMYTPEIYTARQNLRNQYVAAYGDGPAPSTPTLSCTPLYVYSIADKKCQPTNATYTSDQYQCVNNNKSGVTCAQNLATNPGKATGACYSTLDLCTRATDLTGDGQTTSSDYQRFLTYYQAKNNGGDFNKDGIIDIFDYNMLIAYYK